MRKFLSALSSILFDENVELEISTRAFKTFRFGVPIYSGSALTPEISHLILRAKEDNDLIARRFLAKLICDAIKLIEPEELNLVLIPSRKVANRVRGIKHINELVKEVKKEHPVKIFEILEHKKKIEDQTQLTGAMRFENMAEAFRISEKVGTKLPASAYLIDDLVTTGATISAAAKALQVRNIQLLGVITACATMVFTE